MTLSTSGLNWLAKNAGSGNCFASSRISYRDGDGVLHTGATRDVVNAFVVAKMTEKTTATIIAGTNYSGFKAINDGYDLSLGDVSEATDRQADGGTYPKYCVGATPPSTVCTAGAKRCKDTNTVEQCKSDGSGWYVVKNCGNGYECKNGVCVLEGTPAPQPQVCTAGAKRCKDTNTVEQCKSDGSGWYVVKNCGTGYKCSNGSCVSEGTPPPAGDKPVTGPIEVYVGGGESCSHGAPSVTLDTSEAYAFFKSTPYEYIGVGGIEVHNQSTQCRAYFAWEARVWDGHGYTTCPITVPEMQEITRYLAEAGGRPLSLTRLDASETDVIWGSFEVPANMEGEKTLCLSLWGNYDYEALIDELHTAGYYDKT